MNTFDAITTRRSTRKYLEKEVDKEKLKVIVEAGRYAPSGGNNQTCHFIVIENKDVLKKLGTIVQDEFSKMKIEEDMYKSLKSSILQSQKGNYNFYYHAPVLIVLANNKNYGNAMADCVCALENMMIMSNDLDLGSCYINQLNWLSENERIVSFFNKLGLKDNEKIYASLCLGYPDTVEGKPIRTLLKRHGNQVTFIK